MGTHHNLRGLSPKDKSRVIIKRAKSREYLYELCLKLFTICDERGLRLIVENPYATQHFLHGNFPYVARIIDRNRTKRGDFFNKPTQYWFVHCDPTEGFSEQIQETHRTISRSKSGIKAGICSEERSMISPDYARNFICDFILGKTQPDICPTLFDGCEKPEDYLF